MPFFAPPLPELPPGQVGTAQGSLRYEDIAQDGRLMPLAVPPTIGLLWRQLLTHDAESRALRAAGIIPLLTRLTIRTDAQPIRLDKPIEVHGGFQLAHDLGADGAVARIYLKMWCEVQGARGRLFPPEAAGPQVAAGGVFAEHVFTRPFAPPAQRKVTAFALPGFPAVPPDRYPAAAPRTAMDAPPGARWLDELALDPTPVWFTLDHTDSNQHVNSLVYVRVFGDAAHRRLGGAGHPLAVLIRDVDIAYRKPCFAGDRVRVHLRLFELDGDLGAAGFIAGEGEEDRPRCYVRIRFAAR
jgi:hypothetical protein